MKLKDLQEIQKVVGDRGCIVGGALRSIIEGNTPRDVDIMCATANIFTYYKIIEDLENHFSKKSTKKLEKDYMTENMVAHSLDVDGVEITVITPLTIEDRALYSTPEYVASSVDFDICAMAMNPDGSIYYHFGEKHTKQAIKAREFKIIRPINSDYEETRCNNRIFKYECNYGYKCVDDTLLRNYQKHFSFMGS